MPQGGEYNRSGLSKKINRWPWSESRKYLKVKFVYICVYVYTYLHISYPPKYEYRHDINILNHDNLQGTHRS